MVVRSLRYQHLQNSITSLTAAADRGAAVAAHVRRARGRGVRGAGLDEYDGLARLSAAEGHGRARYVLGRVFLSYFVPSRNGSRLIPISVLCAVLTRLVRLGSKRLRRISSGVARCLYGLASR